MESFYLIDTKPLPFVCHPLFAHSPIIHYMVFKKNKMSTNAYSIFFFLFDLKQTLQKSDAIDTKCTLSKCTHLTKNKTDLVLVQYFFLTF